MSRIDPETGSPFETEQEWEWRRPSEDEVRRFAADALKTRGGPTVRNVALLLLSLACMPIDWAVDRWAARSRRKGK